MHKWEELATWVLEFSKEKLIQSYVRKLKPHIQNGLKMNYITSMEMTMHEEKARKFKLERSFQKIEKIYSIW